MQTDSKSGGSGSASTNGSGGAAAIATGSQAPFKLAKTVLTSFAALETDPTYVLHMAVSASKATTTTAPTQVSNSGAAPIASASGSGGGSGGGGEVCCVAAATSDHVIKMYDYTLGAGTLTLTTQLAGHKSTIHDISFVPGSNNSLLVSASEDGSIILWDTKTGKPVRPFKAPVSSLPFFSAAVSGNILSGGAEAIERTVDGSKESVAVTLLWNIQTGELLHTLDFHTQDVTQV